MSDHEVGLYQKYTVERIDGRDMSMGCFVLELKDSKARKAIWAYAKELEKEDSTSVLAYDLKAWVGKYETITDADVAAYSSTPLKKKEIAQPVTPTQVFERIVLLKKDMDLNTENLYVVNPEDVNDYRMEGDLELGAKLTVDLTNLEKYIEEKRRKEQEVKEHESSDPMFNIVMKQIYKDFEDSPYTDKFRYWDDHDKHYNKLLGETFGVVREKFLSDY